MLKVNRKVEYGLVALKHMFGKPKGQLSTVREICEHYGTPFDPVAHVLRILNAEGVVRSEQGAHGGYRLEGDLNAISFAQFIQMIEGHLVFIDCMREDGAGCGIQERCNIVSPMNTVNSRLVDFLQSISVAEMLRSDEGMEAEGAADANLAQPNA